MSMNENSVKVIGRLGNDPEVSKTNDGKSVCNFSVATSKYFKKDDGDYDELTTWVPVTAWERLADKMEKFAQKGAVVFVSGELREKKWEDKETGQTRYRMFVLADKLELGEGRIKPDSAQQTGDEEKPRDAEPDKKPAETANTKKDDDLPF